MGFLLPMRRGETLPRTLSTRPVLEPRDVHFDYARPGQALGDVEAALVGCKAGSTMLKRDRDLSGPVLVEAA